jgi:hypothetical protein
LSEGDNRNIYKKKTCGNGYEDLKISAKYMHQTTTITKFIQATAVEN